MKLLPLSVIVLFFILVGLIYSQGLYFNVYSSSLQPGIYKRVNSVPQKGMYGASCLTPPIAQTGLKNEYLMKGRCPSGIQPVMKRIYASEGDTVAVIDHKIFINGEEMKGFDVLTHDSKGREVQYFFKGRKKLAQGKYWLMSDYKNNSWDSRYWGPVSVEFVLEPVCLINP